MELWLVTAVVVVGVVVVRTVLVCEIILVCAVVVVIIVPPEKYALIVRVPVPIENP